MSAPIDLENVFIREIERNDGSVLKINQSAIGDVGCVVWDAALVLSKYLETSDFGNGEKWRGKTVVELGAGTGVVGLMAATNGSHVCLTDLEEFVPLLQMNIDCNKHLCNTPVRAATLKWGEDKLKDFQQIDFLLLADCIYYEESLEPLVDTLDQLCSESTCVLCCYEERTSGNKPALQKKFFQLVEKVFKTEKIPLERQDTHYASDDIHIYKFTKLKR